MTLGRMGFCASAVALVLFGACEARSPLPPPRQVGPASVPVAPASPIDAMAPTLVPPAQTKRTGCVAIGALPDAACTPGGVMTTDLHVVCERPARERRHVGPELRREVFAEYGIATPQPRGAYEVDHLIPLELGGDNSIANLWPEAALPAPGFHEKDEVENSLHTQVCSGAIDLGAAQRLVATDWVSVWRRIHGQRTAGDLTGDGDVR